MKKIVSFLFVFVLLVSLFTCAVYADGTASAAVTSDNDSNRGATVTLTVSLSNCPSAKSIMVDTTYDSDVLTMTSGEWSLTGTITEPWDSENPTNEPTVGFNKATDVNGNIFTLTFTVKNDAAIGDTTVSCRVLVKIGETTLLDTNVNGTVTVKCKNHDFTAQNTDATYLQ